MITEVDKAEDTDEAEFERHWDKWREKDFIPLANDHLKLICQVWFERGIVRGVRWGDQTIDKMLKADHARIHDSDTCSCEMCQHAAEMEGRPA